MLVKKVQFIQKENGFDGHISQLYTTRDDPQPFEEKETIKFAK